MLKRARFHLPISHEPGVVVPSGPSDDGQSGARCSTCAFYHPDGAPYGRCGSSDYQRYYGTDWIPVPPQMWCTDWWVAKVPQPSIADFGVF